MAGQGWTESDVPDQAARTFLVTGANGGLGYETARVLAQRRARVILACRRAEAGEESAARIRALAPGAQVEVETLDLADLASVEACAGRLGARLGRLDCLVNNAAIMGTPRAATADGFERQFGVNHLGHFALTGRLIPVLRAAPAPRVVTLTSDMYRFGRLDLTGVRGEGRYGRWRAYCRSKLANLLFALQLDRGAGAAGWPLRSLAAHPGYAATGLQLSPERRLHAPARRFWAASNRWVAQSAAAGALPTLRAATDPEAPGGALYAPSGLFRGPAEPATPTRRATDGETARRLWELSQTLTGVHFPF